MLRPIPARTLWPARLLATVVALVAAAGLLTGCGRAYETDSPVVDELLSFADSAEPGVELAVADTTDFGWDRLFVFGTDAVKSDIDTAIGTELFGDDNDERLGGQGTLLVFTDGDELAHAVLATPELRLLFTDGASYGPSTTATVSDDGARWLVLAPAASR